MIRQFNLTICLCLSLLLPTSAFAQQGEVNGFVKDRQQQPLPGATVLLKNLKDSSQLKAAMAGDDGRFSIAAVPRGKYLLQVSFITYQTQWLEVSVPEKMPLTIVLPPASTNLETVQVTGRKPTIVSEPGKMVMNVEKSVVSQSQNAFELLKDLPGVTVSKDGEISVKGKKGVTVMLDGELTQLSAAQLKNLLKATAGTSIKAIEVYSTPPASMDAAGNAGVINIRFTGKIQPGLNGSITSGLGWGKYMKTDHGFQLNYGKGKWNIGTNYTYSYDRSWWHDSISRSYLENGKEHRMQQVQHYPEKINSHLAKLSVQYAIDSARSISLQLGFDQNSAPQNGYAYTRFIPDSTLHQRNDNLNKQRNFNSTLQYKWMIDGKSRLSAALHTAQLKLYGRDEFDIRTPNSRRQTRNFYPGSIATYTARVDYTRETMFLGKVEAGVRHGYTSMDNTRTAEVLSDTWWKDAANSNRFRFSEHISALYAQTELTRGKWSYRLGLRAEHTTNKGDSLQGPVLVKQDYWSLFPNAALSYSVSDNYKITASYARRIERPDYQLLNPAIRYLDPFTIETGLPTLRPQFSQNFELTQTFFKYAELAVGYNRVKNPMVYTIQQDDNSPVVTYTTLNASLQHVFHGSLSFPLPLPAWWENYNTVYGSISRYGGGLAGRDFKERAASWGFSTNNSFKLPAKFTVELNAWYDGGGLYGALRYKSLAEVSAGFSKQLLDDRLTVGFSVSDIFRTNRYRTVDATNKAAPFYLEGTWESRIAKLSLTWRFGRIASKKAEEAVEENDRMSGKKGMKR